MARKSVDTQLVDQQGIGFLSQAFAQIGCVLNEYSRETGIDAILEIREENYQGSGKFIAIQLKSGDSFFKNESDDFYHIYIDNVHIDYWLKCCFPVMFVIFSPSQNRAYWHKIDKNTLVKTPSQYKLLVSKSNTIPGIGQQSLYQFFFGPIYEDESTYEEIYNRLKNLVYSASIGVVISGLELYINGMRDLCSALFFSTGLLLEIIETKMAMTDTFGVGYSFPHGDEFLPEYYTILNQYNLISGSFDYELYLLNERELWPSFLKPLTSNGNRLNEFLRTKNIEVRDRIYIQVVQPSGDYYLDL